MLRKIFPLLQDLKGYNKAHLQQDLVAGLTVGIMLVPQGMAYAFLAGMPPIYGLYGGLIPLLLYGLLGTSRQLSIGPVAISALLVLAGVSQIAEPSTPEYIGYVIATGLFVGLFQILLGCVRGGFLTNFLSHPVIAGFTSGAALIIAISQLKDLLGFEIPRFKHSYETLYYAIQHIDQANLLSVAMCIGAILLMLLLKRINRALPSALITVIIGIFLTWQFDLTAYGLDILKDVPQGMPAFVLPDFGLETLETLLPVILTVGLVGYVESISIAKMLESKHTYYTISPNHELFALGISKVVGAFFQALPTSGSFTRSAINHESGARTGIASIVTAALIALTLAFLTPLFYYLPKAILAAIILLAVRNLFEWKEAIHLWKHFWRDFLVMSITFLGTFFVGIKEGIAIGVALSLIIILYRNAKPNISVLGRIPQTTHYRNLSHYPKAVSIPNTLIVRFESQLYFANSSAFKENLKSLIRSTPNLQTFILDAHVISEIDSAGIHALTDIHQYLQYKGIRLKICGAVESLEEVFEQLNLMKQIGEGNFFRTVHEAVTNES